MEEIDLSNVESGKKLDVPGSFNVAVEKVLEKTSLVSGNKMLKVKFFILDQNKYSCYCWDNFVLIESMLWKLKKFLKIIGEPCEGKVALNPKNWKDKHLKIYGIMREYNGRNEFNVQGYDTADAAMKETEIENVEF